MYECMCIYAREFIIDVTPQMFSNLSYDKLLDEWLENLPIFSFCLLFLFWVRLSQTMIRIVGLSTTLPNYLEAFSTI